jgi:hypothetical protein
LRFFLLIVLLITSFLASAQRSGNVPLNSFYVEVKSVAGDISVGHASLNYDRRFGERKITCVRVGLSASFNDQTIGIPTTLSWLTNPRGQHHFEGGLGFIHRIDMYNSPASYDPFSTLFAQYRYHTRFGFLLRAGVNYYGYSWAIYYPVGVDLSLSLGYTF